jgi:hypothetical protein
MLSRSISSTEASPTAQAVARDLMYSASSTRRSGLDAFGVVEPGQHQRAFQHDAGRDDGPGERPAADFVDAADPAEAALECRSFVGVQTRQATALAFAGEPALVGRDARAHAGLF